MLKSYVYAVVKKLTGLVNPLENILENDEVLSSGISIATKSNELARLGKVKDAILKNSGIKGEVFFADFNWKVLLGQILKGMEVKEIVKFPQVSRDLALVIDKTVKFSSLKELAYKSEKEILKDVSVFDVYEPDPTESSGGTGIPKDKKSYALRFILQSDSKTLSDKEIEKVMEKLTKAFTEQAGAVIRG